MKFVGSTIVMGGMMAGILVASIVGAADNQSTTESQPALEPLTWQTDYAEAMALAKSEKKLMLIHFFDPARREGAEKYDEQITADPYLHDKLADYVLTRLSKDTGIMVNGEPVLLLEHPAFDGMKNGPGIAIIDFAHEQADYFGYVVTVLPFTPGKYYRFQPEYLPVALNLPAGTLSQRTMIFAVRIHPEGPASTRGEDNQVLADEANRSATYQAQIHVQGHHNWDSRFQRIIGRLLGLGNRQRYQSPAPVEVVAESWPDEDLVDSCVDCVASWRQSDGHWSAVKAQHVSYGYDIRRGSNGIWYAAGIFTN